MKLPKKGKALSKTPQKSDLMTKERMAKAKKEAARYLAAAKEKSAREAKRKVLKKKKKK